MEKIRLTPDECVLIGDLADDLRDMADTYAAASTTSGIPPRDARNIAFGLMIARNYLIDFQADHGEHYHTT